MLNEDGQVIDAMAKIGVKGIINVGLEHAYISNAVIDSLVEANKVGIELVVDFHVRTR